MTAAPVKLVQSERQAIAKTVRRAMREQGYEAAEQDVLDAAAAEIEGLVEGLGRFGSAPYTDISDYAHSFARQLYPAAARDF